MLTLFSDHLPAIQGSSLFSLKAIYSRSKESAEALASQATGEVQTYFDTPEESERPLDALLAREDIKAVVICVPILSQPAVVRRALAAGKHVLSEKPIAPDVATAKDLLDWHSKLPSAPLWGVAENYRYVTGIAQAAEKVKELGGKLVSFRLSMTMLITEEYKYLQSECKSYRHELKVSKPNAYKGDDIPGIKAACYLMVEFILLLASGCC